MLKIIWINWCHRKSDMANFAQIALGCSFAHVLIWMFRFGQITFAIIIKCTFVSVNLILEIVLFYYDAIQTRVISLWNLCGTVSSVVHKIIMTFYCKKQTKKQQWKGWGLSGCHRKRPYEVKCTFEKTECAQVCPAQHFLRQINLYHLCTTLPPGWRGSFQKWQLM